MVDRLLKQDEQAVKGKNEAVPLEEDTEMATIDKESEASEPSTPIKVSSE